MVKTELKNQAYQWANKIADDIIAYEKNRAKGLRGDSLYQYEILKDMGWFDVHPAEEGYKPSLAAVLAIGKYKALAWAENHPKKKPKVSKWERVTGKKLKGK